MAPQSSDALDPAEPVKISLGGGDPRAHSIALSEYWTLFWVAALGADAAICYQTLATFLLVGKGMPSLATLLAHLNCDETALRDSLMVLSRARLLDPNKKVVEGGSTLIYPPPLLSPELAQRLLSAQLQRLHRTYLERNNYKEVEEFSARPQQIGLLDDQDLGIAAVVPAVPKSGKGRKTSPESVQVVEHFRTKVQQKSGMARFEIPGYGTERRLADVFLKDYGLEDTLKIIDAYFEHYPNSANTGSLKEIRTRSTQIFNRLKQGAAVAPTMISRFPSKIIAPGVSSYKDANKDANTKGSRNKDTEDIPDW